MIQDGQIVWDAPCVTGNLSKSYDTPAGLYSLTYKQKDRVLRGKLQADGTYEYESPVSFWMPFNGGIGFHDANWRSKFGGTIYQTAGSHGCVNLPPEKAALLYDLVYAGMPVICYN
jgi:lipoprotein-anchoring transpeptidase ErfK/SrfK